MEYLSNWVLMNQQPNLVRTWPRDKDHPRSSLKPSRAGQTLPAAPKQHPDCHPPHTHRLAFTRRTSSLLLLLSPLVLFSVVHCSFSSLSSSAKPPPHNDRFETMCSNKKISSPIRGLTDAIHFLSLSVPPRFAEEGRGHSSHKTNLKLFFVCL